MVQKPDIVTATFFANGAALILSPDGTKTYFIGNEPTVSDQSFGWIDTATNTFGGYVVFPDQNISHFELLIDPTETYGYSIDQFQAGTFPNSTNALDKFRLSDGVVVGTAAPVGGLLFMISLSPDGAYLTYASNNSTVPIVAGTFFYVIDTSTMTIVDTISSSPAGTTDDLTGMCAWTSDSATAVCAGRFPNVYIYDMGTLAITNTLSLPSNRYQNVMQCLMSADDSTCWVSMQHIDAPYPTGVVDYDVVVPLDMSGLTWGTPVVLNTQTNQQDVGHGTEPVHFWLSDDESTILFGEQDNLHSEFYWRAVDIATSTVLKTVPIVPGDLITWRGVAKISDTKFYLFSPGVDNIRWIEPVGRSQLIRHK